ncbi:MAG: uroporphyrinogen-III C-methyltransferase [Planctomycetota bacterium]
MKPFVYLIGAGPGDPELLTMRGARCLRRSDVVLYDGLSNAELLSLAPQAEAICVGKHGQSRIWKQQEILEEILRHARAGKVVSRLKGGDPAVFARTAEEVEALEASGIGYEIIPGITAALAAGSYAGIPVTHRRMASAVALVTGHEEPGKGESSIDWNALAKFPGTLVVYMGVTTAKRWTDALLNGGMDPATPAALVRRCSLPDQTTIRCRLDEIAERLTPASKFRPPVIAMIGPVCTLSNDSQMPQTPLRGQNILVTRPSGQATEMADRIRALGGQPIVAPAIRILPPSDFDSIDAGIRSLPKEVDDLVFFSANGVEHFFARLRSLGFDSRQLSGVRVAVVGEKTAARLALHGIHADLCPVDFRADSLAERMIADTKNPVRSRRIMLVRADRGGRELNRELEAAGAKITEVTAYRNADVDEPSTAVTRALDAGNIDWVTITSSATARSLYRLYGDSLSKARLAAISPVTASVLEEFGLRVNVVADPFTVDSMLQQIAANT